MQIRPIHMLFLILAITMACSSDATTTNGETENKVVSKNDSLESDTLQIDSDRLKHIRLLHNRYPSIELPFEFTSKSSHAVSDFDANYGIDTLVFGKDAPCHIIGVLPDTSEYFGFFYLAAFDEVSPSVITYNKRGHLIDRAYLIESCWHGCESDCRFEFKVGRDHQIEFKYEYYEFDFNFDENYCAEKPNKASGFINKSYLNKKGKVVQVSRDTLSQEELFKDPMIHTFD